MARGSATRATAIASALECCDEPLGAQTTKTNATTARDAATELTRIARELEDVVSRFRY